MTVVRVKGFKIFSDRHGKTRCYHRASSTAIDLVKCPIGSIAFFAECARIVALTAIEPAPKPGTLGLLINRYRASTQYLDEISTRTRSDYAKVFDYLKPIADTPLIAFNPPLIVQMRDKAGKKHGRRFGTYVKQVLSLLFGWGRERGFMRDNPAADIKGIKRPKDAVEANRPWADSERDAVMSALPAHMKPVVGLMMFCGLDPQDAVGLPRTAIKDGRLDARRGKTKVPVWLPIPAPLQSILEAAPTHIAMTLCANSYGKPWSASGLRASWRPIRMRLETKELVAPGLTLKGLRHTVATILAEMGYDERTIADMLGQKTIEMARHYSRRADKSRKMLAVVENFDAEVNRRRTASVKPGAKNCQTGKLDD